MLNQEHCLDRFFIILNISESQDTRSSNLLDRAGQADQPSGEEPQEMEEIVTVNNQN